MATKTYKAVSFRNGYETRYAIVDIETGEVLDDAQGYGYKTAQKAYAGYGYKHRSPEKKKRDAVAKREVQKWCKQHRSAVRCLEQFAFEIAKGSWAPDDKFDAKFVTNFFKENGYTNLPFTAGEFLK